MWSVGAGGNVERWSGGDRPACVAGMFFRPYLPLMFIGDPEEKELTTCQEIRGNLPEMRERNRGSGWRECSYLNETAPPKFAPNAERLLRPQTMEFLAFPWS
jgi:hypothetical protein